MKYHVLFLLFILLGFSNSLTAQAIAWHNEYNTAMGAAKAYSIDVILDGGFIITGNSTNEGLLLLRAGNGGWIWTKKYSGENVGSQFDIGYSVKQTSDDGYIITGTLDSSDVEGHNDLWILKTDSSGDTLWTKTYGGINSDIGFSIRQTADNGYIVLGMTGADYRSDVNSDIFLLKIDAAGDSIWTRKYGKDGIDIGHDVRQTPDNGFIIIAEVDTSLTNSTAKGILLLKTDNSGNTLWTREWGIQGDKGLALDNTTDGGFILAGFKNADSLGWLIKTNAMGDTEWEKTFEGGEFSTVLQTNDGGFVMGGKNRIIWTDSTGTPFFTRFLNTTVSSTTQTDLGFYGVAGHTDYSLMQMDTSLWMAKIVHSPIAIIIADSVWFDNDGDGWASDTLDASNSFHTAGDSIALQYDWNVDGDQTLFGEKVSIILPIGIHRVLLQVWDHTNGLVDTAMKEISVVTGDRPIPVIIADSVWQDLDEDGFAQGTLDGSSSFHLTGLDIVDYEWREATTEFINPIIGTDSIISTTFPTGSHGLYLIITDENGVSDSAFAEIKVHAQLIKTGGPISSAISSIGDSIFYSSSEDDKVYYFDRTGQIRGTISTSGAIRSTTTVGPDNVMYVGSSDTRLYAFDINGNFIWDLPMGDVINSSPAVTSQDILYVGVNNNRLFSLNGNDGSINWNYLTGGPIISSASIGNSGTIYFGSDDGKLYALNPDGTLKWSFTTGGPVQSSPALDTLGNIYFGSDDGSLYALDSDGSELWNFGTGGEISSPPVIGADGTVYFGSNAGPFYALNSDGSELWNVGVGRNGVATIAINGNLYIGTSDGTLAAVSSAGTHLWNYNTNGAITAPPIITADNMIYFGSQDGNIYGMVDPNMVGLGKRAFSGTAAQWPTFQQNNRRTGQRSGDVVSVKDDIPVLPLEYSLSTAYPNPFNPITTIEYSLPKSGEVLLIVYNLIGEEVSRLVSENQREGYYKVTWNASNVASGIYLYRLQAGDFVQTRKMLLLK